MSFLGILASEPNWAEIMTAFATAVLSIGLLAAVVTSVIAAAQVREARRSRHSDLAAEFIRRWSESDLVDARRLVASYRTPEELRTAFLAFVAENSADAYVLSRELDYFEQLGALVHVGAFDLDLVEVLAGRVIVERWALWSPSVDALGDDAYPMFRELAARMAAGPNANSRR
jgi:hypothetical protein